ncbi:hypothetical protein HK102_003922, partial [Quaeritorhiza haematococci]
MFSEPPRTSDGQGEGMTYARVAQQRSSSSKGRTRKVAVVKATNIDPLLNGWDDGFSSLAQSDKNDTMSASMTESTMTDARTIPTPSPPLSPGFSRTLHKARRAPAPTPDPFLLAFQKSRTGPTPTSREITVGSSSANQHHHNSQQRGASSLRQSHSSSTSTRPAQYGTVGMHPPPSRSLNSYLQPSTQLNQQSQTRPREDARDSHQHHAPPATKADAPTSNLQPHHSFRNDGSMSAWTREAGPSSPPKASRETRRNKKQEVETAAIHRTTDSRPGADPGGTSDVHFDELREFIQAAQTEKIRQKEETQEYMQRQRKKTRKRKKAAVTATVPDAFSMSRSGAPSDAINIDFDADKGREGGVRFTDAASRPSKAPEGDGYGSSAQAPDMQLQSVASPALDASEAKRQKKDDMKDTDKENRPSGTSTDFGATSNSVSKTETKSTKPKEAPKSSENVEDNLNLKPKQKPYDKAKIQEYMHRKHIEREMAKREAKQQKEREEQKRASGLRHLDEERRRQGKNVHRQHLKRERELEELVARQKAQQQPVGARDRMRVRDGEAGREEGGVRGEFSRRTADARDGFALARPLSATSVEVHLSQSTVECGPAMDVDRTMSSIVVNVGDEGDDESSRMEIGVDGRDPRERRMAVDSKLVGSVGAERGVMDPMKGVEPAIRVDKQRRVDSFEQPQQQDAPRLDAPGLSATARIPPVDHRQEKQVPPIIRTELSTSALPTPAPAAPTTKIDPLLQPPASAPAQPTIPDDIVRRLLDRARSVDRQVTSMLDQELRNAEESDTDDDTAGERHEVDDVDAETQTSDSGLVEGVVGSVGPAVRMRVREAPTLKQTVPRSQPPSTVQVPRGFVREDEVAVGVRSLREYE